MMHGVFESLEHSIEIDTVAMHLHTANHLTFIYTHTHTHTHTHTRTHAHAHTHTHTHTLGGTTLMYMYTYGTGRLSKEIRPALPLHIPPG